MFGEGFPGFLIGLLVVIVLVLLNGFFVAAEFAIVKIRMTQVEALLAQGRTMARVAKGVVSRLDSYLSATQLGITLVSLGLGWVGEPAVHVFLRSSFRALGLSEEAAPLVSFAVAFSFITFLHIVVGELAPKSLAIQRAESTALAVAAPLAVFYRVSYPAIWLLDHSARILLKFFGIRPVPEHELGYSEEELRLVLSRSPEKEISRFARNLALRALELASSSSPPRPPLPRTSRSRATQASPASRSAKRASTGRSAWCTSRTSSGSSRSLPRRWTWSR